MSVYIDIQGFRGLNKAFIVKEIAILHNDQDDYQHFLIKPPYIKEKLLAKQQRHADWLTKNFHGLHWEAGTVSINSLKKIFNSHLYNQIILVKGLEKKNFLEDLLELNINPFICVKNLEDYNCYHNLHDLKRICEEGGYTFNCCKHHYKNCALQNVYLLKYYVQQLKNFKIE